MTHTMNQLGCRKTRKAGFTLVELMIVVVIMGILSAAVIPAMGSVRTMREGAARDDLVRYLNVVRGRAMAASSEIGLSIDLADSSMTMVSIDSLGAIQNEIDPLTGKSRSLTIPDIYSGVTITAMTNGDGASGSGTVWFDFESTPMTYDSFSSAFVVNAQSATITLSSGARVVVYPYSGTLEVQ